MKSRTIVCANEYQSAFWKSGRHPPNIAICGRKPFFPWIATGPEDVTNKISYYDCTDYIDVFDCSDPADDAAPYRYRGIVSRAIKAPALNLRAYGCLLLAYLRGPSRGGVDTHGGYFHGCTSKEWIYTLAFAGFADLLVSLGTQFDAVASKQQLKVQLSCAQQRVYDAHQMGVGPVVTPPPKPVP
jgi:hypothetical protein